MLPGLLRARLGFRGQAGIQIDTDYLGSDTISYLLKRSQAGVGLCPLDSSRGKLLSPLAWVL